MKNEIGSKCIRRHNASNNRGTIRQDVAKSNPRFQSMGGGILQHINGKDRIHRDPDNNRWVSLAKNYKEADVSTPPVSPPEKDVVIL